MSNASDLILEMIIVAIITIPVIGYLVYLNIVHRKEKEWQTILLLLKSLLIFICLFSVLFETIWLVTILAMYGVGLGILNLFTLSLFLVFRKRG